MFDPDTTTEILGTLFSAISGYAVFRDATFLKDHLGEEVASPLLTLVDDGRPVPGPRLAPVRRRGPADPTQRAGRERSAPALALRLVLGAQDRREDGGCARRGVGGGPSVGAGNLLLRRRNIVTGRDSRRGVARGLYVTDLIGFGVNVVTGDYSQGAVGHWIKNGQLTHPVHEVTIAGNLTQMLRDVDAVGSDLVFRGSSASPTIRIRRMTCQRSLVAPVASCRPCGCRRRGP